MAEALRPLLRRLLPSGPARRTLWYYTPMAVAFSRDIPADVVVYDNMDELTGFLGAPAHLLALEAELFARADLVFTGGMSLYRAKRHRHPSVHAFPSSIDKAHFARARGHRPSPPTSAPFPVRAPASSASSTSAWMWAPRAHRGAMPGLAVRHDRAGGEDRPRRLAAAAQHPLARAQGLSRPAGLHCRLDGRPHALRAQRGDALHQPHQDAGIPRRRRARGLHRHHRRRLALWRQGSRCHCRG